MLLFGSRAFRRLLPAILVLASSLSGVACGSEEGQTTSAPDARAAEDAAFADAARGTLTGYAKVGRASYDESVRLAKLMEKSIEDITKGPTQERLDAARVAW